MTRKTGMKNTDTPKICRAKSEPYAPRTPIKLCVGFQAGRLEAVFSEGPDGEYDASARNRRSAETNNRKPISSLSRRFLVGVNATETNFMKAFRSSAKRYLFPTRS